ncbi:hypothetical protein G7066_08810 [Leucobacter coleopterorum]|uniref:Membrane-associated protein n=1 Tax=Leucobacter coleopterorum TaxID=2714933 RepID=A0ABX6JWK7_9MICO|nr:DUF6153 family protein [Leucobacter coleopterorum]QIM18685.1 hypothetical protein G7066_08810 [Leucobacter coleopterorum]
MEMIRLPAQAHSSWRRGIVLFVMLSALIFGLLGMHILSMSPSHNEHEAATSATVVKEHHRSPIPTGPGSSPDVLMLADAATPSAAFATEAFCGDNCDTPAPHHSTIMVGCVLALLAGVLIILVPLLLEFSWSTLVLAVRSLPRIGSVLLRPHPPSLFVLSISRT